MTRQQQIEARLERLGRNSLDGRVLLASSQVRRGNYWGVQNTLDEAEWMAEKAGRKAHASKIGKIRDALARIS